MAERGGPVPLLSLHTSAGVDVNATYHNQQTPLHLAAAKGVEAACRVLIELRANVTARGKDDKTPLELAGNDHVKAALVEHTVITDDSKNALLLHCAHFGLASRLRAVLQAGANAAHTDQIKEGCKVKAVAMFTSRLQE